MSGVLHSSCAVVALPCFRWEERSVAWASALVRLLVSCSKYHRMVLITVTGRNSNHELHSISEVSPPSERGMLMSGYQTVLQLSALAGFWVAFAANTIFQMPPIFNGTCQSSLSSFLEPCCCLVHASNQRPCNFLQAERNVQPSPSHFHGFVNCHDIIPSS